LSENYSKKGEFSHLLSAFFKFAFLLYILSFGISCAAEYGQTLKDTA